MIIITIAIIILIVTLHWMEYDRYAIIYIYIYIYNIYFLISHFFLEDFILSSS